jgi:hypothetical protein
MGGVFKAIGNAVSGVVKAVGSIVKGVVSAVGSVVSGVLNFVMSPFLGLFGMPNMPDISQQNQTIQGVTLQRQGSDQQIPVIYGFRKVGGIVTFAETGSDNNKYLYVAYVLGEGEIEGVRDIWIEDIPVGASNIPNINNQLKVTITDDASGKLKNRTMLEMSRGNASNVGTAVKAGIFAGAPSWTTDMAYNGLAVIFARYEWVNGTDQATIDANPFGGQIPQLQCTVLGRKILNLETLDVSNPSNITPYYMNVTSYSCNPANIILDYLRNPYYGKGVNNNDIDWDSFKKAALKYNQVVTYTSSGVTGPIQTLHAVVDTSQTLFNNVKLLLQQCRSYLPYSRDGTFMLKIDDAGNDTNILSGSAPIVRTFTKDNIIGSITYTGIDRTSKYNQIVATYCDPDQQWSQQSVTVPAQDSAEYALYLAEDCNRVQKGDLSFPWITNFAMAQDMARLALQKSRWQDTISFTATSEAMDLQVGDCIYVQANILKFGTDPNAGAVKWRIVSTKVNNDYSIAIGCVRNQDNIYPHVNVNDRDYKLAVYVPKGVTRIYPPEPTGIPIGLQPPKKAPTDPTDPTNPIQPPAPSGPSGPLIDVITIYDAKFLFSGSLATAIISWTNPGNTLATKVSLLVKTTTASTTSSQTVVVNLSGTTNSAQITNLAVNTAYTIVATVQYITGDYSTKAITFDFNPGDGTVANPPKTPGTNLAIDYFKSVNGSTITTGTSPNQIPLSPRSVSITLVQDTSIGANQYLGGVLVYYKPSANAKWYGTSIPISVTPGANITFTIPVGARLYPQIPGQGLPNSVDAYDFIFRFSYTDGKVSKWQWRAMGQPIEWSGLQYQYNLFLRDMTSGQGNPTIYPKEDASTYIPVMAGPNDITETRNITVSAFSIKNESPYSARIFINPPIATDRVNWVGVRVYKHKAGVAGTGDSIDITPVTYSNVAGLWSFVVNNITWDETWEFVIVPLVYYGTSVVEANNSQYLYGYLHNRVGDADYPADSNWIHLWTVAATESTTTARAKLGTATARAIRNDTYFEVIGAFTVLTSGVPSRPRKLSFIIKTSNANGINGSVSKVRIYYKFSSNVYWKYTEYPISAEAVNIGFDSTQTSFPMDLGVPQYPNAPQLADNYDFYFRIVYTDGTMSKYCTPFLSVNIEDDSNLGTYSFNPFGNRIFQPQTIWQDLVLESNAPPGSVTDPRTLTLTFTKLGDKGTGVTSGQAVFYFTNPVASMLPYYAGVRIYRRDLTPGGSSGYTTNDNNQPIFNPYGSEGVAYQDCTWDVNYAYLVTPVVWYNGALTNCTKSWYWAGPIHNRQTEATGLNPYPGVNYLPNLGNWLTKSAPQLVDTNTALASLTAPVTVANPVVTLSSMKYIYGSDFSQSYYEIKYIKPANTVSVAIYRRSYNGYSGGGQWDPKNLYGIGRWEQINVNDGNTPIGSTVTVNLRDAIYNQEFNAYYDPTKTANVNNPSVGLFNYLYGNMTATAPTLFQLSTGRTQILIVVTYNSGQGNTVSTQGYLCNLNYGVVYPTINTTYTISVTSNVTVVNIADYESLNSNPVPTNGLSLLRKLSEARSVIPVASLIKPGTYSTTGWSYPSVSPFIV